MPVRSAYKTSLCFVSLGVVSIALANTQSGVTQLQPVVVQAPYHAIDTPWTTHTDRQALDDLQIQSWSDFGQRADPGVKFNPRTQSINIRGLDESRVNTRIDGIRQPWLNDGARGVRGGLSAFDFNTLWALHIVRGVDSNAVGSGALGAAIKLTTLSPHDLLTGDKGFAALVKTDLSTLDQSTGINTAIAWRHHSTSWLVQAGVREGLEVSNKGQQGGYGAGRSQMDPANYGQQTYLLKVQQRLGSEHRFGLTGEHFEKDGDIDNMSAQGANTPYRQHHHQTHDQHRRERLSFDYRYQAAHPQGLVDELHAKVYWQQTALASDLNAIRKPDARGRILRGDPYQYAYPYGSFVRQNSIAENLYGADAEISKYLAGTVAQTFTLGGEWFNTDVTQYSAGQDNCPSISAQLKQPFGPRACTVLNSNQSDVPPVLGTQWAAWYQHAIALNEIGLTLSPSIRYDSYQLRPHGQGQSAFSAPDASTDTTASGARLSPKLLASWSIHDEATLYAQYATGFNAPSATQLYSRYGSYGSYLNLGNPDLQPETSQGYELGLQLGSQARGASLTYFDNQYKNLIESNVPIGATHSAWQAGMASMYPLGVTTSSNIEQARIYGLEARGHLDLGSGWRLWGSAAWADGRDQQTDQALNSVAPLTTTLGLGYRHQQWGAHAIMTAAAARTSVKYPTATPAVPIPDYQTPGYGVVDLAAYWRPSVIEGLTVQLGVNNLFDKQYWLSSGVPSAGAKPAALAQLTQRPVDWYSEPGRNYRLTLTYQY